MLVILCCCGAFKNRRITSTDSGLSTEREEERERHVERAERVPAVRERPMDVVEVELGIVDSNARREQRPVVSYARPDTLTTSMDYLKAAERETWESPNRAGLSSNKLYTVNTYSHEYQKVKDLFMRTMTGRAQITSIERVENGPQHESFHVQKKNILRDLDVSGSRFAGRRDLVRTLFHGSNQKNIQAIVNGQAAGFIPILSGSVTGHIYGTGSYFARDAGYSHDYTEDVAGERKMLLNEVIVGEWAQGAPGMSNYPKASGTRDNQHRQCNSLVNKPENPSIFVIPHANQAYPAYVITYTGAAPPPRLRFSCWLVSAPRSSLSSYCCHLYTCFICLIH